MFHILEGSRGNILGIEIIGPYTKQDAEKLRVQFEKILSTGNEQVNILLKIDEMDLRKTHLTALIEDSFFALKHLNQLRHIAVVGNSRVERFLVEMDDKLFGKKERERIERYFDVADMSKAWDFICG